MFLRTRASVRRRVSGMTRVARVRVADCKLALLTTMSHLDFDSSNNRDQSQAQSTNESSSSSLLPLHDEHLWFPDGSIVLATESRLFCVHKGVLALQSTVFKDLFDIPVPSDSEIVEDEEMDRDAALLKSKMEAGVEKLEMYEGKSLVVLAGDRGEDVVHLLRAIYERECVIDFYLSKL